MPSLLPITAVIELTFDPITTIGGWTVRLETLALAVVVLASLLVALRIGMRTPVDLSRSPDDHLTPDGEPNHLRADDLLYIVVAVFPGAAIGGRLGYVLLHLDYYNANQAAILDPARGSLELSLAVLGGALTGTFVAGLLGAPVGRWLHALALPLLFALGAGKAALVLGGSGQGTPSDAAWATAYVSPGLWGSLGPAIPSHPAQLYEAIATGVVLLALIGLLAAGAFGRRDGRLFLLALALWSTARAFVAATWRDPVVGGGLRMEQLLATTMAGGLVILLVGATARARRHRVDMATPVQDLIASGVRGAQPDWPDPDTRPPI